MSGCRIYIYRTRELRPWVVAFLKPDEPGVELYQARTFKRWTFAWKWAYDVSREVTSPELEPVNYGGS